MNRNALYALLAIPILFRLLRARRGPSREVIIPPSEERVVLLGASSGVGKDLALEYAKRGAKMWDDAGTVLTPAASLLVVKRSWRRSRPNASRSVPRRATLSSSPRTLPTVTTFCMFVTS